jgi:hypothetical protein
MINPAGDRPPTTRPPDKCAIHRGSVRLSSVSAGYQDADVRVDRPPKWRVYSCSPFCAYHGKLVVRDAFWAPKRFVEEALRAETSDSRSTRVTGGSKNP